MFEKRQIYAAKKASARERAGKSSAEGASGTAWRSIGVDRRAR